MLLYNPTDNKVSILVEGVPLSVGPKETVEVDPKFGIVWQKTHSFLQIVQEPVASAAEVKVAGEEEETQEMEPAETEPDGDDSEEVPE